MMHFWRSVHVQIDGASIDRDKSHPGIELVMEPMGRMLPPTQQSVELSIRIGGVGRTARLDQKGVDALRAFLEERP